MRFPRRHLEIASQEQEGKIEKNRLGCFHMPFKINISNKEGKTYKLEVEAPALEAKELGNKIQGTEVSPDLTGYEFEITGASDKSGFTAMKNIEGVGLKKVLLGYGKAMHMKPKGDKKKATQPKGLKMRKTVRGKIISPAISQINLKVLKQGGKKLSEIFSEQNKKAESKAEKIEDNKKSKMAGEFSAEVGGHQPQKQKPQTQ